jgi:hypothetical protein
LPPATNRISQWRHDGFSERNARFGVRDLALIIPASYMGTASSSSSRLICCGRIASVLQERDKSLCVLADRNTVHLPVFMGRYLVAGDEITFPVPVGETIGAEIFVSKSALFGITPSLYLAPIGCVSPPKTDKRGYNFVSAEVAGGGLGITALYLPCAALRDYFYRPPLADALHKRPGLYEQLGVLPSAAPAELRVAFKLRCLELQMAGAPGFQLIALERAFNILAQPELRACYDTLLSDPDAPVIFPYGGFGSLLTSGNRSRDGSTYFVRRILAFLPQRRQRHFHLLLRRCDFYEDSALCRDVGRKLEFWIDKALLHLVWDASWNRWKHLLGAKIEVDATFVQSGKYRKRKGSWELVQWEKCLPSRLTVHVPANLEQQVEDARNSYYRMGQHSRALDRIRLCLEHRAIEKTELGRMCAGLGIAGQFDVVRINWRPDYDEFFYRQLSQRARRVYLFRGEYIFDMDKVLVIETPQMGHATYVFAKPSSVEAFFQQYTRISKEEIRRNHEHAGERLGFLKRVIHGSNPRIWLKELCRHLGEKTDSAVDR